MGCNKNSKDILVLPSCQTCYCASPLGHDLKKNFHLKAMPFFCLPKTYLDRALSLQVSFCSIQIATEQILHAKEHYIQFLFVTILELSHYYPYNQTRFRITDINLPRFGHEKGPLVFHGLERSLGLENLAYNTEEGNCNNLVGFRERSHRRKCCAFR